MFYRTLIPYGLITIKLNMTLKMWVLSHISYMTLIFLGSIMIKNNRTLDIYMSPINQDFSC